MKFSSFLKDKILQIALIIFGILTIEVFLVPYPYGKFIKIYIPIVILTLYSISILIEYFIKARYYSHIYYLLNELDNKYLITEVIKNANFIEGKILKDILEETDKSMLENVNQYKYSQEDYKEYIEMWIHEIKTPIATSKMIIENNKSEITKSIDEELNKIDNYIEQALYYARSNTVEKDYYIKKNNLKDIVNEVIRKNRAVLITEKVSVNTHDLEMEVNTDSKWIVFILNQIIQNSIKYMKNNNLDQINIYAKQGKENITLYIEDNGIGIKEGEINRVFEKGFTGTNGRISSKKSTGIGLYICKKLCDKLGIAIELNSTQDKGTQVILRFPNDSYIDMK